MKTFTAFLLVFGTFLFPALAQDTPTDSWTAALGEAVDQVPGVQQIVEVVIDAGDLRLTYVTAEADEVGYRAEMLEVLRAVGQALATADLELTLNHVILTSAVDPDDLLEEVTIDRVHLEAYGQEKLTRTELLDLLSIEPLEHLNPDASAQADV